MGLRGNFIEQRESNLLDGAAPWYTVYETADGQHVSVGAIEPQFFSELCQKIGLAPEWRPRRATVPDGQSCGPSWRR